MPAISMRRTLLFFATFFFLFSSAPYIAHGATTGAIDPVKDGTNDSASWEYATGKPCNTNICYTKINDNNDTTIVYSQTINTRQTFTLSTSTTEWTNIPVGSTITAIDITFSANAVINPFVCGGSNPTISVYPTAKSVRVLDASSTDFGSAVTMTDAFTSSTQTHSISYVKGATSTLEVGLTIPSDGTCDDGDGGSYSNSIYVQLSKVYATITYTPPAVSITIAGTIYQDEGTTATSSTVKVVVGGSAASSTSAGAGGTYTVTMTQPVTSTVITVYMDNGNATSVGATVTRYAGTNLSGIDVYRGRVILRYEDSGPITNTDIDTYDSTSDTDIPFTVTGGVLNATSAKVIVASGKTFQPGGAINAGALYVIGTFTPVGNTITLNRPGTSATCTGVLGTVIPFCVSGTFNIGTSTINYTATSSVTLAAVAYYNFGVGTTADSSAVTYTLGGNTSAAGVVTVGNAGSGNSDTLSMSNATLTLSGSGTPLVFTSQGALSGGTGTVSYTGTSATTIAVPTSDSYYGLQVGTGADASAVTYTLGGNITVTNRVTIGNSASSATDTLSPSSYVLTITGVGRTTNTPLQITSWGALSTTVGTVTFSGNGNTDIPGTSYFSLYLKPQSGNIYYLATTTGQTITVNGDFKLFRDVSAATVDASTYNPNLTVKGNFIVGDCTGNCGVNQLTFTKGTGTITLTPGGTKTWQDSNPTVQDLGIISINSNGSTPYTIQLNSDIVATSITITSGGSGSATLNATSTKTITITGTGSPFVVQGYPGGEIINPGVFNSASSTVRYIGITTSTNIGAATYWNLFVGTSTGSTTYTFQFGTGTYSIIQNTFTIASSTGTNTLNGGTGVIRLLGSGTPFVIAPTGATSTPGSSTFSYRGSSATTITSALYWNLDTNNTATYTLGGATTVSNDVTVTAGTLAGTSNLTVNGGDITGAGTVTLTGGTATISGAGSLGGATDWTFSSLTASGSSQTTTSTGAGAMTVGGVLTVSAGHTFSAGGKTWTLSNAGNVATPLLLSGTFNAVTSTVQFTGNYTGGNTSVASTTYYKLTLNHASEVFALQSPATVNNIFTVITGTATFAAGGVFAFNNDYLNNGNGGASTGTVTFSATSTGRIINAGALAAGFQVALPTVVFNGSGGGWSFATSTAVIDSLFVTDGTVDNSGGTADVQIMGNATTSNITCGATCGIVNFTNANHTVTFYTTGGTLGTTSGSNDWTFNNLTTTCSACGGNHEAGSAVYLGSGGTGNLIVKKVWTMNPSADIYARGRTIQFSGTGTPMVLSDTVTFQVGTSTVVYAGQTTSTIVAANPYYNLQIGTSTATTTYTLAGNTTINNVLTVNDSTNGTNTLAGSSYTITLASSGTPFVINESPVSSAFSAGTGKVKYNGAAVTTITAATYYNLDVMPSSTSAHQFAAGTFIIGGQFTAGDGTHTGTVDASPNSTTLSITGTMLIATSSTFKGNAANTVSIGGNYTNYGTFTHNSGQVTLNGTATQTLSGSMGPMEVGTSAFSRLVFSNNSGTLAAPAVRLTADATTAATSTIVTASTTVRFNADSTYTFNSLNWNGQATTSRVGVRSSTAGLEWFLSVAGAKNVSSTDVKDSNACGSGSISVTDDSLDSGGNTCWIWPLPGTPGTPTFPYVTGVSVVVNWTAASSTTSYNLFRSTSSGGIYVLVASTTITSSTDTGLTQSTTYWYKVMGVNSYGNGPTSTAASVTTLTVSQGYATSSSLTSVIYDTAVASGTAPNSITWQGTRPTNTTVKFQFAGSNTTSGQWTYTAWNGSGSNDPTTACDSNSYYPLTGTSEPGTAVELKALCQQNKRYIRYKIFLESTSSSTTPTVTDIILNYAK